MREDNPILTWVSCVLLLITILILLFAPLPGHSQTTTDVTVTLGVTSKTSTLTLLPKSTITFSISNCSITSTPLSCILDISISTSRLSPASLQFDLDYPAEVISATVAVGPAATAASKQVQCNSTGLPAGVKQRCVVSGTNQNKIQNGVVARVTATVTADTTITLKGVVAATAGGGGLLTSITPGGGAITIQETIASFACAPSSIEPTEDSDCTVTLPAPAPSGGVQIAIAADSVVLTGPASVTVAQGQTQTVFKVTAK